MTAARKLNDAAIDQAPPPTPEPQPSLDDAAAEAEIDRLSKLKPLAYARDRAKAAAQIGIAATMLDKLVKAKTAEALGEQNSGQGREIELPEPEHWPMAVDGAAVLDEHVRALRKYVVVTVEQADAATLWAAHSHAHDAYDTSPKLILKSPQKRSGKTRLVEFLSRTVARPLAISGISSAALLRLIEMHRPTLLLDEMDAAMKQNREKAEALRGLINSGFDRATAYCVMNVPTSDGGYEPRAFSTWCPQLLSGIGNLPDTVRDRAIEIDMQRKPREQKVSRLRRKDGAELIEIAGKLVRWAADNMAALRQAEPAIPSGLNDRAADGWEPLFAIADRAGGDWPERARKAALAISGDTAIDDEEMGSMLLADVRAVFTTKGSGHLSSADLADALAAMEDRPWADWRHGKAITRNALARLLKPYGIAPDTIRMGDRTPKGYRMTDFENAFTRYLVPAPHSNRNTATTLAAQGESAESEPQHPDALLRIENCGRPNNESHCCAVADEHLPSVDVGSDADLLPDTEADL
jgi:putative DNA primase/helicase